MTGSGSYVTFTYSAPTKIFTSTGADATFKGSTLVTSGSKLVKGSASYLGFFIVGTDGSASGTVTATLYNGAAPATATAKSATFLGASAAAMIALVSAFLF
jgi:hypothetical protein